VAQRAQGRASTKINTDGGGGGGGSAGRNGASGASAFGRGKPLRWEACVAPLAADAAAPGATSVYIGDPKIASICTKGGPASHLTQCKKRVAR